MKPVALGVAGLILAEMAGAQNLPPEVLLLSRVENHIKEEFQRLASITCLETAQREVRKSKGKMRSLDTVRLEVLTNGEPGAVRFSRRSEVFRTTTPYLCRQRYAWQRPFRSVSEEYPAQRKNANTQYKGEEDVAGRRLARYDYQLDPTFSGQTIDVPEGSGSVGLKGSFWVDPGTYDVIRLELNAEDIPPSLPISALTTTINYGRTTLTNQLTVLLPQAADVHLVKNSGDISHDQVEFTHCRVFGAESTVDFNPPDTGQQARFGDVSLDDTLRRLPGGLQITVKLRSRVSSDSAVGTLIDGVVAGDVKDKHAVVIPAGSPVRGRIRRMERYTNPFAYFVVGIEFTEVEVEGVRHIFYADLVDIDSAPGVELTLNTGDNGIETPRNQEVSLGGVTMVTRERVVVHNLPGVATFFFRGDKLDLPQNFRTVWKTRTLK